MGFDNGGLRFNPVEEKVLALIACGVLCGSLILTGVFLISRSFIWAVAAYGVLWVLTSGSTWVILNVVKIFGVRKNPARVFFGPRSGPFFVGYRWAWLPVVFLAILIEILRP
jgi:hypothetical protein